MPFVNEKQLLARSLITATILCTFAHSLAAQKPATAGTKDAAIVADFQSKVREYVDLKRKAAGQTEQRGNDPAKIVDREREAQGKIRVARAGAKQGEIFSAQIAEYFRRQINASLAGAHGNEIRASLQHSEPVNLTLQINQGYPAKVPLQSTPPTLLLNLPDLPDGLEYRLVGRELVLRDTEANVVVDYIPNAFPDLSKSPSK